jgi:hypothetical protein
MASDDDGYQSVRYKLSDEDAQKFAGPEWVTFDRRIVFHMDANELMEIEEAMNVTIGRFLMASLQGSAFGIKGMVWLARRMAGIKEDFKEFNPHIFELTSEKVTEEKEESADPTESAPDGSPTEE